MGTMSSAMTPDGQVLDRRELADQGLYWAFNGTAGLPDEPLVSVRTGTTVAVTIRNDTVFPHAMHLHGHHFRVLIRDGVDDPNRHWRDTELAGGGETVTIAFVADNPGSWLLHCHMLEHAASGMTTWLQVT